MMTEQEALVPTLIAETRDLLMARMGAHAIRAEGGDLVVTWDNKTAKIDIPEIENVFLDARRCADAFENLLTGR